MTKKLLRVSVIICTTLVVMACVFSTSTYAAPRVVDEGTSGSISWKLESDGKLTISGSGVVEYKYVWNAPWNDYKDNVTDVVVNEGITGLCSNAFEEYDKLESVSLPNSLSSLGKSVFANCSGLKSIAIPQNVTYIPDKAFVGCKSLREVMLPNGLTSIGDTAFGGCESLPSINLPESLTSMGDAAFSGCRSFKTITIPSKITKISMSIFSYCKTLEKVVLPNGIKTIADSAFYGCEQLKTINLPDTLTSIDQKAFGQCTSLPSIKIPKGITEIKWSTFSGCSSLKEVNLPVNLKSIGGDAFNGCKSLKRMILPDNLATISGYAFYNCSSLSYIVMSNGVTSLKAGDGNDAFYNCTGLKYIYYKGSEKEWNAIAKNTTQAKVWNNVSVIYIFTGIPISQASIDYTDTYRYTGNYIYPKVNISFMGSALIKDTDYSVSYKNNREIGTATITVTGKGLFNGTINKSFEIIKKSNTISVSGKTIYLKAKKLKKKTQNIAKAKALTIENPQGTVTYEKVSLNNKKYKKKFTINKNTGSIKVKKGVKKGTYKMTVRVMASGDKYYSAESKKAVVTIRVK